ncbi:MAG: o-succinylbenzoate synthase [Bacteroidaceae bacterium]
MTYKIDILPRILHFCQPAGTSRGVYTLRRIYLLRLTSPSSPQCEAWGECAPLPALSQDDLPSYQEILRHSCKDFEQTGIINYEALRPYPSILFGIETALLHFQAKSSRLFSTPFSRGEEGIPINGLVWMGSYDEMLERIEQKLALGYHCIKLKIGAIHFDQELELLQIIRSHYPSTKIELRVDANGAFTPTEALRKLEKLAHFDLHSIEQPIRAGQYSQMAELCKQTPVPIALDEELIGVNTLSQKQLLLQHLQPQYIILKPSLHGGISGGQEWIDVATEYCIPYWITSALESNVGLNAIAQWTASLPDHKLRPQGLGTGQLFTDNIPSPLTIIGDKLWFKE